MRYEKLDWELSTETCHVLHDLIEQEFGSPWGYSASAIVNAELAMIVNQLRARLQHRDPDPHSPKNQLVTLSEAVKMIKAPADNTDLTT